MITLDTSALYALLNRRDRAHAAAVAALESDPGPYLVPAATLGTLDCGEADLGRARQLVQRYEDLSLGYVHAAVIACAERNGGRILTFDLRDFGVVAAEGTITILPGPPQ